MLCISQHAIHGYLGMRRSLLLEFAAYALSPIDLIPDFIPVVGYLDDLLIVPLGIMLAIKLVPPEAMAEHRAAAEREQARPQSLAGAAAVVAIWIAIAVWLSMYAYRHLGSRQG